MDYKQTLQNSINRIEELVSKDIHLSNEGFPLPSWIELSPIDVCNRACVFCPKSDDSIAPNQNQKMLPKLYEKIATELKNINFSGTIMLAGYGEPLLNKDIINMCKTFSTFCNVEITTNGDPLNLQYIQDLYNAGLNKIIVSMYDGEHQIEEFKKLFLDADISEDKYILRDRWYTQDDNYGVKLTNRAGVLINENKIDTHKQCFYPSYSMMVDWNGDVFLCTQDWNRRIKTGNLMISTVIEVWTSQILKKYRTHLSNASRDLPPCNRCDANGTLHGEEHAKLWTQYYEK
ncbi:SPASM domain-containing protein [Candidatus Sulfurimonas marisnigri]|uniref:SPASM domain-containing protein n=1 Tax=Candidatus Sulfurimonas marisnigri TaxID=2740405 RepID=A0A7S7M017_9BACT|nr:radical SAM/SPASM domain-containing protein [Candidatus Sulfurimonas marisnigri]QOY54556.1 SPASM domain-containing protein [Candidatus Sulfurimonas marisnigri]